MGTFLLMLISALAVAAWMDPALVPESASLLRTAGAAVGLVRPAGPRKGTGEQFGISREELPYDGNAMPDTAAGLAASSPTEASSSGNSAMPEHDAGADPSLGTDTASASSGTASDLVKAEQIAPNVSLDPTSVLDTETKPKSSVKPHPKQAAVSPETRKREISRLRRQAEDELYAE